MTVSTVVRTANQPRIEGSGPETAAPAVDCGADPLAALRTMFVDMVMGARIRAGQDPVLRPVFLKPHGVARGSRTLSPRSPAVIRRG